MPEASNPQPGGSNQLPPGCHFLQYFEQIITSNPAKAAPSPELPFCISAETEKPNQTNTKPPTS
jgi:hypothetical protein